RPLAQRRASRRRRLGRRALTGSMRPASPHYHRAPRVARGPFESPPVVLYGVRAASSLSAAFRPSQPPVGGARVRCALSEGRARVLVQSGSRASHHGRGRSIAAGRLVIVSVVVLIIFAGA